MGSTTKGIPYPEDADKVYLGAAAMRAIANDLDFSKVVVMSPTGTTNATAPTAYPMGLSVITLSTANAAAGGWPGGVSSQVFSVRADADGRVSQILFRNSNADANRQIFYRQGNASGWSAWVAVGLGAAYRARLAGATPVPANGTVNGSIVFPAGRFTVAPVVSITVEGSSLINVAIATPVAASVGYTLRNDSGTAFPNPFLHVIAVEPTS